MAARAFSLMELTVVLLILAIAAAAVALNVRPPLNAAVMKDAVGQVIQFDRLSRAYARQHDCALEAAWDGSSGKLVRFDDQHRQVGGKLELGERLAIGRLMVAGQKEPLEARTVPYSRQGLAPTYAMMLEGGGKSQWLVIVGLTGQCLEVNDESSVLEILSPPAVRPDAR